MLDVRENTIHDRCFGGMSVRAHMRERIRRVSIYVHGDTR